jgi:deoxycytidine triphosphate deaminase
LRRQIRLERRNQLDTFVTPGCTDDLRWKSTYARCGIIVNGTPLEPEWEGFATFEISKTTPPKARVNANEGLCQILFFRSDEACEIGLGDRKGKRRQQQGNVLPRDRGIASTPPGLLRRAA